MKQHDLLVVGGGPGGYVAAIRAAQLGLDAACLEREPILGGTCLRVGCIPSKAMLESSEVFYEAKHRLGEHGVSASDVQFDLAAMLKRKESIVATSAKGIDGLFRKNKVTRYSGAGRLAGAGRVTVEHEGKTSELQAKNIVLATGSNAATLPGIKLDGDRIGTSTEALSFTQTPGHLVVVGGGYIGMELGSVWRRLGAKVTVLEFLDRIFPGTDTEIAKEALEIFRKQGFEFRLGSRVTGAKADASGCTVQVDGADPIRCDRVLVAVGRGAPNTANLGLAEAGVKTNNKGYILVDEHYQTSLAGVYAIGDRIPGPMLAHKAEEEGVAVAEYLATGYGHVNYDVIPAVIFTHPEIASVGKTEDQLLEEKDSLPQGHVSIPGQRRARTLAQTDGKVKVLAHLETDRVLGVHIFGPRAGDMIAEAAAAMEFGASSEDIARTCHAHPTLAESLKEAALAVDKRTIHF